MKLRPVFKEIDLSSGAEPRALDVFRVLLSRHPSEQAFVFRKAEQTILAIDPLESIQVRDENPFLRLSSCMDSYSIERGEALPEFFGGALGYFSYDSVRHLEPVLQKTEGNLSSSFRSEKKDLPYDGEFAVFKKYVVFDHLKKRVSFTVLESQAEGADTPNESEAEILELIQCFEEAARAPCAPPAMTARGTVEALDVSKMKEMQGRESFLAKVKLLQEHIAKGDIFQAVISERFTTPFKGSPIDLFETLSEISPSPYQFLFLTGSRAFLGASPEMLLRIQQGELETHPIAGTRPRGKNPEEETKLEESLLADPKEKAEHLMLVDLARNDLGRVSETGSVRVESFQKIQKFGGVMHLVSKVKGRLKDKQGRIRALASCFPAGTLSGAPKIRAMQLLSQMEPERRGFYGGAVVLANFISGSLDSCISIRSIEIANGTAQIQAGAGIVMDSVPESEYEEVLHKTRAVRRALALEMARK